MLVVECATYLVSTHTNDGSKSIWLENCSLWVLKSSCNLTYVYLILFLGILKTISLHAHLISMVSH